MLKVSLTSLKPVHIIAKYLGIWPSFNPNTMARCGIHYKYGIIALIIIICLHTYGLIGKILYSHTMDNTVFIMVLLSDFATTLTNISTVVNINFVKGIQLNKFLQQLQHLDAIFHDVKHNESKTKRQQRHFYLQLFLSHCVFMSYVVYNYWAWSQNFSLGWTVSQFALLRDVQFYHVGVSVFLIRGYVLLIKYKVEGFNYILEHHVNAPDRTNDSHNTLHKQNLNKTNDFSQRSHLDPNLFVISAEKQKKTVNCCLASSRHRKKLPNKTWSLTYISKVYTKLTNTINEFNDIFGWNLVVFEIQLIINLLLALNLALVYGGGEKLMGTRLDYNLYILCLLWFVVPLGNIITVIAACDTTKREMNKMPSICYNLILECDEDDENDRKYIQQVKELALQGHLQAPEFTAAGFFSFNYSLVFPTMTSIISYFIVLIQFRS